MQVAEILSDLTSLRVCDYSDALALVTANKKVSGGGLLENSTNVKEPSSRNQELERAKELVDLHYAVKTRHVDGKVDKELSRAREDVSRVLRELSLF
ncbi:hypothetical protein ASPZODRAFT_130612 [Penicilliopsis zonata CBS 506.65]|uniref:Uncharacterized protein n=1 Tax=Penicilliopsis zonata CBS 506.65 TaxID=1073090 RepID=A0A1L9SMR1_9EURO|nr:hypothetical protein ASPZODRAFT_130612 [Penicilliopsis zonata CBS 506.65]OJJ48549.1 hypothetical protein ASPZODRAFT_130612 [Penicilliopsis zonata CBS 506.65]